LVRVELVEHPPVVLEVKATTLFFLPLLLQVVVLVEVVLAPLTEDQVVQVAAEVLTLPLARLLQVVKVLLEEQDLVVLVRQGAVAVLGLLGLAPLVLLAQGLVVRVLVQQ
jgi:hypothetical protein